MAFGAMPSIPAPEPEQKRARVMFDQLKSTELTQHTLELQLERHVDQMDMEAALEEAITSTNSADTEMLFLAPFHRPVSTASLHTYFASSTSLSSCSSSAAASAAQPAMLPPVRHPGTGILLQFFQPPSLAAALFEK
jgi:hypothetical protein